MNTTVEGGVPHRAERSWPYSAAYSSHGLAFASISSHLIWPANVCSAATAIWAARLRGSVPQRYHYTSLETAWETPQETPVVNPRSVDAWVADYSRLVVEVLSRTTQDYDRTDKFDLYRGCAALQDYVLVSTRRQSVHVYSRGADGVWLLRPFGPGEDVLLPSIDFRTPIAAVYEDVEVPRGPEIRP